MTPKNQNNDQRRLHMLATIASYKVGMPAGAIRRPEQADDLTALLRAELVEMTKLTDRRDSAIRYVVTALGTQELEGEAQRLLQTQAISKRHGPIGVRRASYLRRRAS